MEQIDKRSFRKGIICFVSIYSILFICHILFAVKGFDLGFRMVAVSITIMTFFVGSIIIYLGEVGNENILVNRFGALISIFLALGLGWAYLGMELHWTIILWPIGTIFSHIVVEILVLREHHDFK